MSAREGERKGTKALSQDTLEARALLRSVRSKPTPDCDHRSAMPARGYAVQERPVPRGARTPCRASGAAAGRERGAEIPPTPAHMRTDTCSNEQLRNKNVGRPPRSEPNADNAPCTRRFQCHQTTTSGLLSISGAPTGARGQRGNRTSRPRLPHATRCGQPPLHALRRPASGAPYQSRGLASC